MRTPPIVLDWLHEKCEREHWSSVLEPRTVTREWVRHTGGRIMRAGLTGSVQQAASFELHVHAEGVEPEYAMAARNAALTVLLAQSWSPVLAIKLTLSQFQPHEVESSYAAFYGVAHEVVAHLLGVTQGTQHNIAW
jgi:hypothetical protein